MTMKLPIGDKIYAAIWIILMILLMTLYR